MRARTTPPSLYFKIALGTKLSIQTGAVSLQVECYLKVPSGSTVARVKEMKKYTPTLPCESEAELSLGGLGMFGSWKECPDQCQYLQGYMGAVRPELTCSKHVCTWTKVCAACLLTAFLL